MYYALFYDPLRYLCIFTKFMVFLKSPTKTIFLFGWVISMQCYMIIILVIQDSCTLERFRLYFCFLPKLSLQKIQNLQKKSDFKGLMIVLCVCKLCVRETIKTITLAVKRVLSCF